MIKSLSFLGLPIHEHSYFCNATQATIQIIITIIKAKEENIEEATNLFLNIKKDKINTRQEKTSV